MEMKFGDWTVCEIVSYPAYHKEISWEVLNPSGKRIACSTSKEWAIDFAMKKSGMF